MEPLSRIVASDLCAIWRLAADALHDHAPGLDQLDVIGTGDHDTGTNLAATMDAVAKAAERLGERPDLSRMATAIGDAAAAGAQGRAGSFLAKLIAGFSAVIRNQDHLDGLRFALALEAGVEMADGALPHSQHVTLLEVARAAAEAGLRCADEGGGLGQVTEAASGAALDALERTAEQVAALAEAGVVDAGAAGWVVVLEVIASRVAGEDPDESGGLGEDQDLAAADLGPRFEVSCHIECDEEAAGRLISVWSSLGDRVEVSIDGTGSATATVRTDDIGAVIEAALAFGRPHQIRVEDLFG
jgi:dihydroxyacetone kinase-like predicted kinase